MHQVELFLLVFLIFDRPFIELSINEVLKPDLVSIVTAHMVYFCAFARSEVFQKNARKLGVGRGQFDAGVNGLNGYNLFYVEYFYIALCCYQSDIMHCTLQIVHRNIYLS